MLKAKSSPDTFIKERIPLSGPGPSVLTLKTHFSVPSSASYLFIRLHRFGLQEMAQLVSTWPI